MSDYKLLPFQLTTAKSWSGLTKEEHFTNVFGQDPIYIDKTVTMLHHVNEGGNLLRYLDQFPTVEIDEDRPYRWKLAGRTRRKISLLRAWEDLAGTVPVGTTNARPGFNGTRFYMDFPEHYFTVTHVIVGDNPNLFHLRVMADAVQVGKNWRYEMQLVTNSDSHFIPVSKLIAGSEWSIHYSISEQTLSKEASDIGFTSPFDMENSISMLRKRHVVPGNMIDKGKNKPLLFLFKDPETGSVRKSWIAEIDYQFTKQFDEELASLIYYGKSTVREDGTTTMKGGSGNSLRAGYGIQEQFSPSNKYYYTKMTMEYLTKVMLEISYNKIRREDRNFTIATGEWGLKMLHEMCVAELGANDYSWLQDTTGRAFSWDGNNLSVKMGQFVGYATINGINVKFMYMPSYDDNITNKIEHPDGGIASSYRLTIMDMGSKSEPNIQKVRIKGQSPAFTYIPGLRNPYDKGGKGKLISAASEVDGYTLNKADWVGGRVKDPTRIVEFIPAILK